MERFLALSGAERREALAVAAESSGRPPHLLEKDVWVVFALDALFSSGLHDRLVFKGGTSLSKVYGVIDRFSEDVDLTYDIREIADDLVGKAGNVVPPTASQSKKWSKTIADRLPERIADEILPILDRALLGLPARASAHGDEAHIEYDPLSEGSGYVLPRVKLEFGAKSTGEPCVDHDVICDAARHVDTLQFPTARVRAMCAESTWWEKATAVHVFCHQGSFRGGERFARHWYDLVMLDRSGHAGRAIDDRQLADAVAKRKSIFFVEKQDGRTISYQEAVSGSLRLVPEGDALASLQRDYAAMAADGLFLGTTPSFEELVERCRELEGRANAAHSGMSVS